MTEPTPRPPAPPRPQGGGAHDDPAHRLWKLWRQGQPPRVEDFLAAAALDDAEQIRAVLRVDQVERFRLGQGVPAEAYLQAFPAVANASELALDLVFGEFLLREEQGEHPAWEDYLRRFPHQAQELNLQLELHRAMETQLQPPSDGSTPTVTSGALPTSAADPASLDPTAPRPIREGPGRRIGPYLLLRKLGEGGMGAVYLAEQDQPIRRQVALKVIKPGMDTELVVTRFEAERQALALMDHPNIAKVFDAGATTSGRPYFVMELVDGVPITRYCDQARLAMTQRLALFMAVCQAIQHAHQKGIIHRDIKPSNVLVTQIDGRAAEAIVLDEETLRLRTVKLGPDHPDTLASASNLANAYLTAGRAAEAIAIWEPMLPAARKRFGPGHSSTLQVMNRLAAAQESLGHWADAVLLRRELIVLRRKTSPPDSPMLAGDLAGLGANLLNQQKWTAAEPVLRESLKIREAKQPGD
jgi:hypothetical protein